MQTIRTTLVGLVAALTIATPAFAHEGYDATPPPQCQQGQYPAQQQEPTAGASNFGGPGVQQPCQQPAQPAQPNTGQAPVFQRVYRFVGDVNGFDAGVLDVTIDRPNGSSVPAYVLIGGHTHVYDADGQRVSADVLDDADSVAVAAKILPYASWIRDEDGRPTPTFRAKKVRITG